MNQQIIDKALSIIKDRHKIATRDYDQKQANLQSDKKFVKLQNDYTTLKIENAKKLAYNEKVDRSEELKLKEQYESYFADVQPKFSCKSCKDTGYVKGEMCSCLKKEISRILYEESNFGKLISFEEAQKTADQDLQDIYALMKKWTESDFKKNLIFISGQVGVGKTYLTRAMAHSLILRGKVVKLVTAFEMSKDFQNYRYNYEDYSLDKYLECEVLFIDDLGTEIIYKNATVELLYLIINERKTHNLPTIITSNLNLDEIMDKYGERIFSRIIDKETSISLLLNGKDKRIKK